MSGIGRRFACEAWVLRDNILTILSSSSSSSSFSIERFSNAFTDIVTVVDPEPEARLEGESCTLDLFAEFGSSEISVEVAFVIVPNFWFIIVGGNDVVVKNKGQSTSPYTGYLTKEYAILWKASFHRMTKGRK